VKCFGERDPMYKAFWEIKRVRRRIEMHLSSRNQFRHKREAHLHTECGELTQSAGQNVSSFAVPSEKCHRNSPISDTPTDQPAVSRSADTSHYGTGQKNRQLPAKGLAKLDAGNLMLPCRRSVRSKLKSETGTDIGL